MKMTKLKTAGLVAVMCSALFCISAEPPTNHVALLEQTLWATTNFPTFSMTNRAPTLPVRVQLFATISAEVVTNWITTSTEWTVRPAGEQGSAAVNAVYYPTGYHETGTVRSNLIASVEWNGRQIPVALESTVLGSQTRVTWK